MAVVLATGRILHFRPLNLYLVFKAHLQSVGDLVLIAVSLDI